VTIKAPRLTFDHLRSVSEEFLAKYHAKRTLPIPIESIVEFDFKIDIVPMPGLRNLLDVDAFPSSNLREFFIDEFVYRRRLNRYRFSLAHELAHVLIHKDIFAQLKFSTIDGWKSVVSTAIPEEQYSWIEWQAYSLAGLILVPGDALREHFDGMVDEMNLAGISLDDVRFDDDEKEVFVQHLAKPFEVSSDVIKKRLAKDKLWE
jgi:IrrE N-terminal-like domain